MLEAVFQPEARSKRCRQARPLRPGEQTRRARATGDENASQCRTPVALGAEHSATRAQGRHRPRFWRAETANAQQGGSVD